MTIPTTPTFFGTLQSNIAKNGADLGLSIATEPSPPFSEPLLRMSVSEDTAIPNSLILVLDAAYLFHVLARDPKKVVAPGKSLLSVLAGLNQMVTHTLESTSEKFVRKTMHQAFWDQTLGALSSPLSSSQISRLKGLYEDLREALIPLFPPKHTALIAFSLPLPPTSSPLLTAITHLRDALVTLRQRCAPVRDAIIDRILHQIDHRSRSASTEELAELLIDVIRSTLELSIDMRDDYSNAVLATASEQELVEMVATMAETQEQGLVLQLWGSKETMRMAWTRWMNGFHPADPSLQPQPKQLWVLNLIQSLGKPQAVTSKLFRSPALQEITNDSKDDHDPDSGPKQVPESPNMLPPQFLFSGPALFYLQNHIQALTIAASLRSLVPAPRPAPNSPFLPRSQTNDPASPASWMFTERIWTLLESEIGATDDKPPGTKITNLADEVVMAHSSSLPPGVTVLERQLEQRLRSTVDRILRTDDPVFILLQRRLLAALSVALLDTPAAQGRASVRMRTGSSRPQRGISSPPPLPPQDVQGGVTVMVKGFEDPVIVEQCSAVISTLRRIVEWVERVWGDTMPY